MVKKIGVIVALFLIGVAVWISSSNNETASFVLSKKDFDKSCGVSALGRHFVFHRRFDKDLRKLALELIEKRSHELSLGVQSRIPHRIHQIWTKDEELPDELVLASRSIELHHPGFLHTVWRPKDYASLLTSAFGADWTSLPQNVVRDLAAAVILFEHGGIVVDLESEMLAPITPLLSLGDCIVGLEPPLSSPCYRHRLFVSPSVIAAAPSSPIILGWLIEMARRVSRKDKPATWITQDSLSQVVARLGKEEGRVLIVGPTVFCPVRPEEAKKFILRLEGRVRRSMIDKILETVHLRAIPLFSRVARETICVHLRGGRLAEKKSKEKAILSSGSDDISSPVA
jgi:hypothetical protein